MLRGFIVGLILFLVACGSSPRPELIPPTPTIQSIRLPVEAVKKTDEIITGRWATIMSETKFQEREGVRVTVKQLRFSTPERLFPDATEAELRSMGMNGAESILGVRINVDNNSGINVEFNPAGSNSKVIVNGVEYGAEPSISDNKTVISGGGKDNYLVLFPLTPPLTDYDEVRYSIRNMNFLYTELITGR